MGWFSGLFSATKAADNLLDKDNGLLVRVGEWVGDQQFTPQERAENAKEFLTALHPFKVMQRIMVTIIMVEWAILFNVMIVAICLRAEDVQKDLMAFAQTEFAWMPILGAVGLYLFGGVVPSRKKS